MLRQLNFFNTGYAYANAMSLAAESAYIYHYGVLLATIAARLGRRVWFNYGNPLYPNLYVCLVGISGDSRKTTAIRLGEVLRGDVPTLHALSTHEGLLQFLLNNPEALIVFEELASLYMKAKKQDKSAALIPGLAYLYDNQTAVQSLTKVNPFVVHNPTISIISATTLEWLEKALQIEDIMGGSANRFLFLPGSPLPPNPTPRIPNISELVNNINRRVAGARGEMFWDEDAEELWKDYYIKLRTTEQEALRATLSARLPDMTVKVAMIIQVLEGVGNVIVPETLQAAIDFISYAQQGVDMIRPLFSSLENKILQILEGGEISKARLHERIGGRTSGWQLAQAIESLIKLQRINITDAGRLKRMKVR